MINLRVQSDRVQVAFWDAVIHSLSGLRTLRTYRQETSAPALRLQPAPAIHAPTPTTRFQLPLSTRLFILQGVIGSLAGFLVGFLYGILH